MRAHFAQGSPRQRLSRAMGKDPSRMADATHPEVASLRAEPALGGRSPKNVSDTSTTLESFELYRQVLDTMAEGVSVIDEAGLILYTNPAEDQDAGYLRSELLGKHIAVQSAGSPAEGQHLVQQLIEQVGAQGEWSADAAKVRKDGAPITTRVRVASASIGGKRCLVCVQEDLSGRDRIEKDRAELFAREQEARVAAEAGRRRADFLARASREFSESLDPQATLDRMAHLAVLGFADWCTVTLRMPDGSLSRVAAIHKDPARAEDMAALMRLYPPGQHRAGAMTSVAQGRGRSSVRWWAATSWSPPRRMLSTCG